MKKGETIVQRVTFRLAYLATIFLPPFASFQRLEGLSRKWLKNNPQAYTPRKGLAGAYKLENMYLEAKEEYEHLNRLNYLSDKDTINFAEILFHMEDYERIVKLLLPIVAKHPNGYRTNGLLGRAYLKIGDATEGIRYLEKLLSHKKLALEDLRDLGICYWEAQNHVRALKVLERAREMNPNSSSLINITGGVYFSLGNEYLKKEDFIKAQENYEKSLQFCPNDQMAKDALARLHEVKQTQ